MRILPERSLEGWGRVPLHGTQVHAVDLKSAPADASLFRGLGRSYGDASLPAANAPLVVATPLANRLLSFDDRTGVMVAEAGFTLAELARLFVPRGWFAPAAPGTMFVTLGGMVASDVHGKDQKTVATIGSHVHELTMRLADGSIVTCSRGRHRDLFLATLGGMGLTGHILRVTLQLQPAPSPWIVEQSVRTPNLASTLETLENWSGQGQWRFSMAWLDGFSRGASLGRGLVYRGRWGTPDEAPWGLPQPRRSWSVPVVPPLSLLRATSRTLNSAQWHRHPGKVTQRLLGSEGFFFPLDSMRHWNRLCGPRGFTQHHCVLPREVGVEGVRAFLSLVASRGLNPFLSVLKVFGAESDGLLSFPRPGYSLAMDFPIDGPIADDIQALNAFLVSAGGRIYLAKDLYTSPRDFRRMYPRLPEWLEIRSRWDPTGRIQSALSRRLMDAAQ